MKIRDILYFLYSGTHLIVQQWCKSEDKPFTIYDGEAEMLPYWIADMDITADCMDAEGDAVVIDATPDKKRKQGNNNQSALDALGEEEVLIYLAGLLYHYDAGTIHDEQYSEDEWQKVFWPMMEYVEKRVGEMLFSERMSKFYREKSGTFQNGNDHGTISKTETVGEGAE